METQATLTLNLNEEQIRLALPKVKLGLSKYLAIQSHFKALTDGPLGENAEFMKRFNGFYRVSRMSPQWYDAFYKVFDNSRKSTPSFFELLTSLYAVTNRCEASFASKLLATLDPTMPVIDSIVLSILKTKIPRLPTPNRLEKVSLLHQEIGRCYREFLGSKQGESLVSQFKSVYSIESKLLSEVKMLDFILWQTREEKIRKSRKIIIR